MTKKANADKPAETLAQAATQTHPAAPATETAPEEAEVVHHSGSKRTPEDEKRAARIADLDEEIRRVELETKLILLEKAKRSNQEFVQDEASAARKSENVQRNIEIQRNNQKARVDSCAHMTGGFGLEDFFDGDGKPALVTTDLPIVGMRLIICTRCLGEWGTPDPNLKQTNPDLYLDQQAEWLAMLKMSRKSMCQPIGVPTFKFENEQGLPANPVLV